MLVKCECGWTGDLRKIDQSIQDIDYGPVYVCPDCGVHNEEDCWEYIEEKENTLDI